MNKKLLVVIIIFATAVGFLFFLSKNKTELVDPNFNKVVNQESFPTPVPPEAGPKTFNFDASTDLKTELESVNPQILDSDFE